MRRLLSIAALLLLGAPLAAVAQAESPRPLAPRMGVRQDQLVVTVDLAAAFRGPVEKALTSGLTHRVRVELRLVEHAPDGAPGRPPVGRFVRDCAVAYDLWGQRFGVAVADARERGRRSVADYGQVVEACGALETVPVAPLAQLDLRRVYRLEAEVLLDPAEDDLQGGPPAGPDPLGPSGEDEGGGSLFGAVASVFDRGGGGDAGARTRFASPPFDAGVVSALLEASAAPAEEAGEREEE